jgi:hypothetical protein
VVQSIDHPELLYLEARKLPNASGFKAPMFTIGRPDGPPLWIVVHDMEGAETTTIAEDLGKYQAGGAQGRSVSSHYCADSNSVVQCVKLQDSAWTVGNRMGNNRGINWEFAGRANQTREQWLDDFGRAMFATAAPIIRSDAARFGIPLRRCTLDDLRARRPGITSHNDLGLVYGGTDHTDPGPNFPWDVFMQIVTGTEEETDMAAMMVVEDDRPDHEGEYYTWDGTVLRRIPPEHLASLPNGILDMNYVYAGLATGGAPVRQLCANDRVPGPASPWIVIPEFPVTRFLYQIETAPTGGGEDGLSAAERAAVEEIADDAISGATVTITPGE